MAKTIPVFAAILHMYAEIHGRRTLHLLLQRQIPDCMGSEAWTHVLGHRAWMILMEER